MYRLKAEDAVIAVGVVCQRRHPAELPVEQVQDGGGVEHLLLEHLQQVVVLLGEAFSHGQSLLQLLLQGALQRFLPGAVCGGATPSSWRSSEVRKTTSLLHWA